MFIYAIYASKHNKDTLISLKNEFTLPELLLHKQFVEAQEDLEAEARQQLADDRK